MSEQEQIKKFLAGKRFAVVGASKDRSKYGNRVLRAYLQNQLDAVPVNPSADEVEGVPAYSDLASVPGSIDGVSIITPPAVTEKVVAQAIERGIKHIWMQPGAESDSAIAAAEKADANVIAGGPCLLVTLRFRETAQEPLKINFGILENQLRDVFEQKRTEETEKKLSVTSVTSVGSLQIGARNN